MQSALRCALAIALLGLGAARANADVVTLETTRITMNVPDGWHHTGSEHSRFHPGVEADVLATSGGEVTVFLSPDGCPRPAGAAWTVTAPRFLPEELDETWLSRLRDTEQGCYATRRGELVIVVAIEDPTQWNSNSSVQLADALIAAASGPMVRADVAEAYLRAKSSSSTKVPLGLAAGLQYSRVFEPTRYRGASALYEVSARFAVIARPVAVRVDAEVGRASTGALRGGVELTIGPGFAREGVMASVGIGASISGQSASESDSFELPEDPIPFLLSVPIVGEGGKRLSDKAAIAGRIRIAFLTSDDARRSGGSPLLGTDELNLEARVSIGRRGKTSLLLGLAYEEAMGTGMFAATAGIAAVPF